MASEKHLTTRRGFIAALGFGGVSLYGVWAAYGAAPGPLALLGRGGHGEHGAGAEGHAGHLGHGVTSGPDVESFNRLNAAFMERYRLPDGTVYPHHDLAASEVIDVYLAAGLWYYQPNRLRLDAGQPYRFRMMAVDVSHGASIQFGQGGRIERLRPGRLTEMAITFHEPGHHLVYCTVYCGPAHDVMQATLEVV